MPDEALKLCSPALTWMPDFVAMSAEFVAVGEPSPLPVDFAMANAAGYLRYLDDMARGVGLPSGYAPQSIWWLVRDGSTVVGYSRLRSHLTPALEDVGGHIGTVFAPQSAARVMERASSR